MTDSEHESSSQVPESSSSSNAFGLKGWERAIAAAVAVALWAMAGVSILRNHLDGTATLGVILVAAAATLLATTGQIPDNPWAKFHQESREAVRELEAVASEARLQIERRKREDALSDLARAATSLGAEVTFGYYPGGAFTWDAGVIPREWAGNSQVSGDELSETLRRHPEIAVQYVGTSVVDHIPEHVRRDAGGRGERRTLLIFDDTVDQPTQQTRALAAYPTATPDLSYATGVESHQPTITVCSGRFVEIHRAIQGLLIAGDSNSFGIKGPKAPTFEIGHAEPQGNDDRR